MLLLWKLTNRILMTLIIISNSENLKVIACKVMG